MGYTDFQAASGTVLAQSTLIASVPTAESTSTKVSAAATESTSTKVMAFFIDTTESTSTKVVVCLLIDLSRPRQKWSPFLLTVSKIGEQ